MKKKHHYRMLFVLLAAGLLCSCGIAAKKEAPRLETYNGFAYTEENGQKKVRYEIITPSPSVIMIDGKEKEVEAGEYTFCVDED